MGNRLERPARLGRLAAAVAAGVLLASASGCGDSDTRTSATAATTEAVRDPYAYARARFAEMCAGCHTLAHAGAKGRRLNLDHLPDLSRARVRTVIAGGEHGMPAYGDVLSRREFEELSRYIVAVARRVPGDTYWSWQARLRGEGATTPPTLPDRPDTKLPDDEEIERQRAVFRSRCGGCHTLQDAGATGTRAGGEADLDVIRPNRSSVEYYVENGFGRMRSFRDELTPAQIRALARYVADADGCGSRDPRACTED